MLPQDRNIHRPPHIVFNNTIYFVTARTVDQAPYFDSNSKKNIFCLCLKAGLLKFQIALYAWVLLNNHYHLLFKIKKGEDLSKFINFLNGKNSFELNKSENTIGRKIWYQYWDHCIRDETDFWKYLNYIHQNPVKHGLCKNLAEAFGYPFSSAKNWIKMKGEGWLYSCFEKYPVIDYTNGVD